MAELTHINEQGRAKMVDVSEKADTKRIGVASGRICMQPETFALITDGKIKKGDVLAVAQVAGVMAAKKTWEIIPMCHPLLLTGVDIHFELYPEDAGYEAGGDMSKRCATYIMSGATGFSAENLTFANDYDYSTPDGKSNKSADALRCDADGASFVNVTISGVQDTLYMHAGNQYYRNCRIEGLIDFIYSGDDARALFEDCELVFVYE